MSRKKPNSRLFVYGTLRKDANHEMYHILARWARYLGEARVSGVLYDLGDFPGLVITESSIDTVQGELYELQSNMVSQILLTFDVYEECGPTDPHPHQYERIEIEVSQADGTSALAWAYVLREKPGNEIRIPDGNYLNWRWRKAKELVPTPT